MSTTSGSKPPQGRPTDWHKRALILASARHCLRLGPPHLNVERIAREAGVSKVTVYKHFGSLEELVRAVVQELRIQTIEQAEALPSSAADLRSTLIECGVRLMSFLTSEEGLDLHRMLATTTADREQLGRLVYRDGPVAFVDHIAGLLKSSSLRDLLLVVDAHEAAEQLVGMWQGTLMTGLLMSALEQPTAAELQHRVTAAVETFMRAYFKSERT